MPNDFHFLTPAWFWALLPLAAILWAAGRQGSAHNAWQRVVDRHLLPYLLMEQGGSARWLPLALPAAGWLLAVVALANPTYERRPVPAVRPVDARVVVLDLSNSMEAADLKPSRLARARYKVTDILELSRDGQVGLVAFAGDAFVVAPLSDDADTLLGMLDALSPDVMPVRGSRPDLGLAKAGELLGQAGVPGGGVILVGDDAGDGRALAAAKTLAAQGRTLSVIGVGTAEGAPVPGARDPDGKPVLARLDPLALAALASAGGGNYATLTPDGTDLDKVVRPQGWGSPAGGTEPEGGRPQGWGSPAGGLEPEGGHAQAGQFERGAKGNGIEADQWVGLGPWVALALLPLAALAFRRGWLVGAALTLALTQGALIPRPALALSWDDLWQRPDQQAAAALDRGDHRRALGLAEQPDQRGTASYRLGDYQAAADAFAAAGGANGDYNRGNALALAGKLDEAIAAYDAALKRRSGMEDALYNKARVEELLKQQQQQQADAGERSPQDQSGASSQGGAPQANAADQASQGQRGEAGEQSQAGQGGDRQDTGQQGQASDRAQGEGGSGQEGQKPQPQVGDPAQGGQEARPGGAGAPQQGADRDRTQGRQGQAGAGPGDEDAPNPEGAEARQAQVEQAADAYRAESARQAPAQAGQDQAQAAQPGAQAEADLTPEEREARQAADQWLRRIPDDPSGLLRRKFLYQYRLRNMQGGATTSGNPW